MEKKVEFSPSARQVLSKVKEKKDFFRSEFTLSYTPIRHPQNDLDRKMLKRLDIKSRIVEPEADFIPKENDSGIYDGSFKYEMR